MQALDALPPLSPAERAAQLEVDVFCVECGYNLHGQPVTRDTNLGIFVARCPECGRYHPAGTGISAVTPWLRRFAAILLVFWVLIILTAVFLACIGFGAVMVGHVEETSYRKTMTRDGREAEWKQVQTPGGGTNYQVVAKGTTRPVMNWTWMYTLEKPLDTDDSPFHRRMNEEYRQGERIFFAVASALMGLVGGVLLVVFLWHWKKRRYLLVTLFPFGAAAFVIAVMVANEEYRLILNWAIRICVAYAAWEAAWMGIGILIGRPVVRTMLRMFIPPRPRQHFACLWHVDGKRMPPAITT